VSHANDDATKDGKNLKMANMSVHVSFGGNKMGLVQMENASVVIEDCWHKLLDPTSVASAWSGRKRDGLQDGRPNGHCDRR